ncbi:MAG: hypothetical protein P4M09_27000 [Devosia sp.]|nr:hypothetical protein [Devosia sp.]
MRIPALAMMMVLSSTGLAYAQFPPPGIYRCQTGGGAPLGTLTLLAAGDYQFSVAADASYAEKADDPGNGKGQLTSASTSISVQSGPLATVYHWKGAFKTDLHKQHTSFSFTGTDGSTATCGAKG